MGETRTAGVQDRGTAAGVAGPAGGGTGHGHRHPDAHAFGFVVMPAGGVAATATAAAAASEVPIGAADGWLPSGFHRRPSLCGMPPGGPGVPGGSDGAPDAAKANAPTSVPHNDDDGVRVSLAPRAAKALRLAPLDGLRALAALWVVAYHVVALDWALTRGRGDDGLAASAAFRQTFQARVHMNGQFAVDVFLLLSGYLVGSGLCSELEAVMGAGARAQLRTSALFLVRRLLRIAPLHWTTLALWLALLHASGGAADSSTATASGNSASVIASQLELCTQHGWATVLFLSNWRAPEARCMGWTWTVGLEMQLYVVTVPLVYLAHAMAVLRRRRGLTSDALPGPASVGNVSPRWRQREPSSPGAWGVALLGSGHGDGPQFAILPIALATAVSLWIYMARTAIVADGDIHQVAWLYYRTVYAQADTRFFAYGLGLCLALWHHADAGATADPAALTLLPLHEGRVSFVADKDHAENRWRLGLLGSVRLTGGRTRLSLTLAYVSVAIMACTFIDADLYKELVAAGRLTPAWGRPALVLQRPAFVVTMAYILHHLVTTAAAGGPPGPAALATAATGPVDNANGRGATTAAGASSSDAPQSESVPGPGPGLTGTVMGKPHLERLGKAAGAVTIWLGAAAPVVGGAAGDPGGWVHTVVVRFLSLRPFHWLSQLSYAVYQVHLLVLLVLYSRLLGPALSAGTFQYDPAAQALAIALVTYGLALVLALVLHLAVERPFLQISAGYLRATGRRIGAAVLPL